MNQNTSLQLGINLSMIFTEVPLIERFALARQAGFDTVEIQFPYELSITEIQQQLEQHQLKLCLINVPAGDLMQGGLGLACQPDKTSEYQQAVQQAIAYATALNVPTINVLSGRCRPEQDEQQVWQTFINNLNYTAQQCQTHTIQVVFEAINGIDMQHFLIQNLSRVAQVFNDVDDKNIALQFDCYHIAMMGEDIIDTLHQYSANIKHIQFADYPHRHQPNTGSLDFTAFFDAIAQSDYQGYVCAEYKPQGSSIESLAWKQQFFK